MVGSSTDFNLISFQIDVLGEISNIENTEEDFKDLYDLLKGSGMAQLPGAGDESPSMPSIFSPMYYLLKSLWKGLRKGKRLDNPKEVIKKHKDIQHVQKDAENIVTKKNVRKVLCPALQSVSNDAYDIAKVITPILVPLILSGKISMPLDSLLFAAIALVIARMGIAGVCADLGKPLETKNH